MTGSGRATVPVMLVQGGTDIQVTEADFERLKAAKPSARPLLIPRGR